ncbi:MAG TPA: hypothetical protein VMG12_33715 [Polyangiaceae bacterium]|nr:hypothetical protein [Polyangiaceae bacterium]
MSSTFSTWFVPAALALGLSGCIFVPTDGDDLGTLQFEWTILGDDDPSDCRITGSDRLELAVYDIFGDNVTTLYPYCDNFDVTLALDDGFYSAELTLVDRFNESVTRTQILDDLDVIEDSTLEVSIDFGVRDFL